MVISVAANFKFASTLCDDAAFLVVLCIPWLSGVVFVDRQSTDYFVDMDRRSTEYCSLRG